MTDFHIEKITDRCAEFGIKIDREITERLNLYGNLLLEWNEKINLTAITAPEDVLYKHFYDCILFFKAVTPDKNTEIIDVGTGAGFPGMVLAVPTSALIYSFFRSSVEGKLKRKNLPTATDYYKDDVTHLYTKPPERTPLTKEELLKLDIPPIDEVNEVKFNGESLESLSEERSEKSK